MAAQDLGTLADYLRNGDNYERVLPDGNVLVIPGNQVGTNGFPPLAPQGDHVDAYREPTADCLSSSIGGTCAAWVHDATTGFYHIGPIADFNTAAGESCICALAAEFENPNCLRDLQAQIDALGTYLLFELMPRWFLSEIGIDPVQPFRPDFFFIACYSDEIIIPNQPLPPPNASCAAPDTNYVNGLCPAGFFADPLLPGCCKPLDPPIPAVLHNLAGATRSSFAVPPELYGRRRILSSTRFEPSVFREAPPPPLPALAVQPLPPGNCGCSLGTSEEIDEL